MSDRYELWHGNGTRSLRVLWLAEELGIADRIEVHSVLFPPRLRSPDFLSINPLGSLPFFVHGDTRMSESIAICQYLAIQNGPTSLVMTPDEPGFGAYLQFCLFGEASMMPPVGAIVRYHLVDPPEQRSETALAAARATFRQRLIAVSEALAAGGDFLAGGRFTLADISVGYTLGLVATLGERELLTPELAAYLERLENRPAKVRAGAR